MNISIEQLSSGYWHIRGVGPCNWSQPESWPCTKAELWEHAFPEASSEFIDAAFATIQEKETLYDNNSL